MMIDYLDRFDLLECARYHVSNSPGDAVDDTDDWVRIMENIGLTRSFQSKLMVPEGAEMRSMASAKEWTI